MELQFKSSVVGLLSVVTGLICSSGAMAQSYQTRVHINATQRQAEPASSNATASVSRDLLQLYSQTKSAASETAVTAIARACSEVVQDRRRTTEDREYAQTLLAWALNRRGEMRNDRAAQLIAEGNSGEADRFDRLAAEDFATAIKYGPSNWRSRHNYAISLALGGNYSKAIEQLDAAIRLKDDYPNAYFNRGEIYFELGNFASAIEDYSNAIELNPKDPQYYNSRAHSRFLLDEYEDALTDYKQATELGADSGAFQTDLADAYQFLGRWEEAAQAYRSAVAINSKFARAYQNAAWLMATCPEQRLRNAPLALASAKKALELGSGRTPQALDTLAAATAANGDFSEAVRLQKEAIALSQDNEEKRELAGRMGLYQQQKSYQQPTVSLNAVDNADAPVRTASGSRPANR